MKQFINGYVMPRLFLQVAAFIAIAAVQHDARFALVGIGIGAAAGAVVLHFQK